VNEVVGARLETLVNERIVKILEKAEGTCLGTLRCKSLKVYCAGLSHIGETGFLFRHCLPAQQGGHFNFSVGAMVASGAESHFP